MFYVILYSVGIEIGILLSNLVTF